MWVEPQKVMGVDGVSIRLAIYRNEQVIQSPNGERIWFGAPAGWHLVSTVACADISERTLDSYTPSVLIPEFELEADARGAGEVPPAIYTAIFEDADGKPHAVLFDSLAIPASIGDRARVVDLVKANQS
jgi:hypothetical protein